MSDVSLSDIEGAASKNGLSPSLLRSTMMNESGGNQSAVSDKGARGVMQLMPSVVQTYRASDAVLHNDAQGNLHLGARLLSNLVKKNGGYVEKGLAAYNMGQHALDKNGGKIPTQVKKYVSKVLAHADANPMPSESADNFFRKRGIARGGKAQPINAQTIETSPAQTKIKPENSTEEFFRARGIVRKATTPAIAAEREAARNALDMPPGFGKEPPAPAPQPVQPPKSWIQSG